MTDLEQLRQEIDSINNEIIASVSRRLDIAKKVAVYKRNNKIPILDRNREESVISFFESGLAGHGMRKETGRILARALIDAAVEEERHLLGDMHLTADDSDKSQ